jgi:predicted nucleotidyltransferase
MVVGGYAVNSYGFMRTTGDLDLWISTDTENLKQLKRALSSLSYTSSSISQAIDELKENKNISLRHGDFHKIEFISFLSTTLTFNEAWKRRENKKLLGFSVTTIGLDDLMDLKIRSGRNKDLLDVKELKRIRNGEKD